MINEPSDSSDDVAPILNQVINLLHSNNIENHIATSLAAVRKWGRQHIEVFQKIEESVDVMQASPLNDLLRNKDFRQFKHFYDCRKVVIMLCSVHCYLLHIQPKFNNPNFLRSSRTESASVYND